MQFAGAPITNYGTADVRASNRRMAVQTCLRHAILKGVEIPALKRRAIISRPSDAFPRMASGGPLDAVLPVISVDVLWTLSSTVISGFGAGNDSPNATSLVETGRHSFNLGRSHSGLDSSEEITLLM